MGDKSDQVKGRVKEAVGSLKGDKDLKREGRTDRRVGEVKEKLGHVEGRVEAGIDKAKDAIHKKER
jgi:uncharacterized protein YjbJ (UPF0337 family)